MDMKGSRTAALASLIAANVGTIDGFLSSNHLPPLSLDPDAPLQQPNSKEFTRARDATLEAISELEAYILGPLGILNKASAAHNTPISLQAICRFDIATKLSTDEASYDEVSRACGLDISDVHRILRHAMTHHIFQEPRKGFVSHNAASQLLAKTPNLRELYGMMCEELWPAAVRTVDAKVKWPGSQEPNHTGFALAKNTEEPIYIELGKYPDRAKRFADAMSIFNSSQGNEVKHLLDNYPFGSFNQALLVDVGGSHGAIATAIAQKFPQISCIVQDLSGIVIQALSKPKNPDPTLGSRVTFMAHDFFTDQPVKNADIYLFRCIFHNWSEAYSIKILRCLVPALKPGARILINEYCLVEPGSVSATQEKRLRYFDMVMFGIFNSKERATDDWEALFSAADPRFNFLGVRQPPDSNLSIIEAIWEGEKDGKDEV